MKKALAIILPVIGAIIVAQVFLPVRYKSEFDIKGFASLPALNGGRLKPLDTMARTTLLLLRGKQTVWSGDIETMTSGERRKSVRAGEIRKMTAIEWLMEVTMYPHKAHDYPVFRIDHPDILGMLGKSPEEKKYFSFHELQPQLGEIEDQARRVNNKAALRSPYERALLKLQNAVIEYYRLIHTFQSSDSQSGVEVEYQMYLALVQSGGRALLQQQAGEPHDETLLQRFMAFTQQYQFMAERASLALIPPADKEAGVNGWMTVGDNLVASIASGDMDPVTRLYAKLTDAYRADDSERFNDILGQVRGSLVERFPERSGRIRFETFLNGAEPFYRASVLYVLIFLAACFSWLGWTRTLNRGAFHLLLIAFFLHTFGLVARMAIQGRPPVTNLYSSAIFVGFCAVLLSIVLERIYRNGIGSAVAGMAGFSTLVIAHNLGGTGDTMEMMRAVLDSNFWLATHVVTITIGYSATFLAGFLAIIYIMRGMFTRGLDEDTARALTGMVYGIICFALLFSFVGTVLGGIWADQSWGRFWGWDPKENGALMIVVWNALVLHARWGRIVHQRGLMILALGGNIMTSWSWFGTNMLGIGLHAYGFMDTAFYWLMGFVLSQILLMIIALLPARCWRSKAAVGA
jgi:ABC-type transport system involved in cytochrome c biogenesis permease subunit